MVDVFIVVADAVAVVEVAVVVVVMATRQLGCFFYGESIYV